jgi:hypothetical protein
MKEKRRYKKRNEIKSSRAISRVRILEKHDVSGTISVPSSDEQQGISVSLDDGDRDSFRNVVIFEYPGAADSPRRSDYIMSPRKL